MVRAVPAAEPTHAVVAADLPIPISVLSLDLAAPPAEGWAAYLAAKGIALLRDDVGRDAISRGDARRLISEYREAEAQRREQAEAWAVEAGRQWRAQLGVGVPASSIPEGLSPQVRCWPPPTTMLGRAEGRWWRELLANDTLTYPRLAFHVG